MSSLRRPRPNPTTVGFFLGAAALTVAIVKYNTIVHPFTLADNRHYMFYVFRYTILRSRAVRFALVPAYMVSAYLVWSRLAGKPPTGVTKDVPYLNRPFDSNTSVKQLMATGPHKPSAAASAANKDTAVKPEDVEVIPSSSASPSTSTALLWLATTALSLVSAPLVEPRYFILPWIFWRLLVPLWPTPANPPPYMRNLRVIRWINALGRSGIDLTAVLETAWFVVINVVTFWIFLSRPYQWRGVDGRVLDEERWQRFMW
jgi:alpha-1,2-glucosyltransferase